MIGGGDENETFTFLGWLRNLCDRRPNFPKRSIPPVRRLMPRSVCISSDRQAVVLSRVLFLWTLISSPSYTDRGGSTLQLWCPTNKMSSMNRILPREGQSCQILWKLSAPVDSELSSLVEIYSMLKSYNDGGGQMEDVLKHYQKFAKISLMEINK